MRFFSIVVAIDDARGIGKNGALPWHIPADLKNFRSITSTVHSEGATNAVIMGRKTWESLPEKFRPLPGRVNVILSRQRDLQLPDGVLRYDSLDQALEYMERRADVEEIFVIGGAQIYAEAILHPRCHRVYATHVKGNFNCDVTCPPFPSGLKEIAASPWAQEGPISYRFAEYKTPPQ